MSSKTWSAAVIGLDAVPVEVEANITPGLPKFLVVGLPDAAVQEARERVMAALKNSDLPFPMNRLIVNLAPADIKKEGPAYDLPIAVAVLLRGNFLEPEDVEHCLFLGEMALDGQLRPVNGVLAVVLMALEQGFKEIYIPSANADEACLAINQPKNAEKTKIYPVDNLGGLIRHLRGKEQLQSVSPNDVSLTPDEEGETDFDFSIIKGQYQAKRALEIAAAGGHNILLSGPPGAGKHHVSKTEYRPAAPGRNRKTRG